MGLFGPKIPPPDGKRLRYLHSSHEAWVSVGDLIRLLEKIEREDPIGCNCFEALAAMLGQDAATSR